MSDLIQQMSNFSAAEEFLNFLDVPYDQAVVNVNRLHILKRFNQYMRQAPDMTGMDLDAQRAVCHEMLAKAYEDFVHSTAAQEKVFKVFQDVDGTQHVSVDNLRNSLPTQH